MTMPPPPAASAYSGNWPLYSRRSVWMSSLNGNSVTFIAPFCCTQGSPIQLWQDMFYFVGNNVTTCGYIQYVQGLSPYQNTAPPTPGPITNCGGPFTAPAYSGTTAGVFVPNMANGGAYSLYPSAAPIALQNAVYADSAQYYGGHGAAFDIVGFTRVYQLISGFLHPGVLTGGHNYHADFTWPAQTYYVTFDDSWAPSVTGFSYSATLTPAIYLFEWTGSINTPPAITSLATLSPGYSFTTSSTSPLSGTVTFTTSAGVSNNTLPSISGDTWFAFVLGISASAVSITSGINAGVSVGDDSDLVTVVPAAVWPYGSSTGVDVPLNNPTSGIDVLIYQA